MQESYGERLATYIGPESCGLGLSDFPCSFIIVVRP
jgi:hypothetical protein